MKISNVHMSWNINNVTFTSLKYKIILCLFKCKINRVIHSEFGIVLSLPSKTKYYFVRACHIRNIYTCTYLSLSLSSLCIPIVYTCGHMHVPVRACADACTWWGALAGGHVGVCVSKRTCACVCARIHQCVPGRMHV